MEQHQFQRVIGLASEETNLSRLLFNDSLTLKRHASIGKTILWIVAGLTVSIFVAFLIGFIQLLLIAH